SYWDAKAKRFRTRVLEHLGPVAPVYPRAPPVATTVLPLPVPDFGLLATRILSGSLTIAHIVQAVYDMGEEMPPGDLAAVGIRFDLGEKTLELLLWPAPPAPRPRPAPSATPPGRSRGSGNPPPSSPSKARER
ncbi:MAG: hypothetical protein ACREB9_08635, partial [Thermoplasmata archaeon]